MEERDYFIESVWPRHPDEEELRTSISRDWIKLGMSEPYQVPKPEKMLVFNELGEWVLGATYHPPDLTARDKDIVKSMGCTPPDVSIQSDPVTITVVNSTK